MRKLPLMAGIMAIGLSVSSLAFAQEAGSDMSNPNSAAANSGAPQTGPSDSMGGMSGTQQYNSPTEVKPGLADNGSAPDSRPNTDYGTLEPGNADTVPGTNLPPTTRNADTTETHVPLKGANSFTQAEATRRLERAGYTNVSGLAKDDQSVWRGTATKDGSQVAIALDYRGNITEQPNNR